MERNLRVEIVTPKGRGSGSGNWATADRWANLLGEAGHEVSVSAHWSDADAELLVALHARRSHGSIASFAAAHPDRPLVVALTGTDLYQDIHHGSEAQNSLELAWRLVVLQERGPDDLPRRHRHKAHVIYQSASPLTREPDPEAFTALVMGNLRPEKDPFRAALASRLLPEESGLVVLHAGAADEALAAEAREHERRSPRYRWLGQLAPESSRALMARSHVLVQSSTLEGGANAVGEAMAAGVPVLASEIPGNVGMLGREYPGYYPVGDERTLAELLWRSESDAGFYSELQRAVSSRAYLVTPERERAAISEMIADLDAESVGSAESSGPRYTRSMNERTRIRLTKYSTKAG
jgi:putative glycosyltransferase (TIGR04348 family)